LRINRNSTAATGVQTRESVQRQERPKSEMLHTKWATFLSLSCLESSCNSNDNHWRPRL